MTILTRGSKVMALSLRGARQSSHATAAEAKEQMELWIKISKGMIGLTGGLTLFTLISHMGGHEHHEEAPAYPYLKLRNKPFPWHYSGCDLLDFECKKLAKEAEKAMNSE